MSREAAAAGISRTVIDGAFAGLTPDGSVLAFDRRQRGTFRMSFEHYAATRVIPARIKRAKQLMQRHAALLARIEREFGVPATLLMAIWTLETDNGTGDMGKLPVIRTLATLAHDCRRSELFQGELLAALQILQRGDLSAARPDRRLCGRDRPDAVSAVLLHQIRRRLRWRRACRSAAQRARRARLDGQPSEEERLAGRRAVRRGNREFRSHARVEPVGSVPQDDGSFCRAACGAMRCRLHRRRRTARQSEG